MWFYLPNTSRFGAYLGSQMAACIKGYFILPYFATFMRFVQFSTNPIAGCDLASLWPPNLEHIWGPKWLPVYGWLKTTKKHEISSKNPCDFLIVSLLSSWRCLISTLVVQCRSCMQVMVFWLFPIFLQNPLTIIQGLILNRPWCNVANEANQALKQMMQKKQIKQIKPSVFCRVENVINQTINFFKND